VQWYKKFAKKYEMTFDQKPKGKTLRRMIWKTVRAKMKVRDRKEINKEIREPM
jgi:hypothetical protein